MTRTQTRTTPASNPVTPPKGAKLASFSIFAYVIITATIPYQYGTPIILSLLAATILELAKAPRLPLTSVIWSTALASLGLAGTLIGALGNQPGAFATTSIYVIEPLLLGISLPLFLSVDHRGNDKLQRSLDIALVTVTAMGVLVYIASARGFSIPPALVDARHQYGDTTDGTIRSNYQGWNSYAFLATYGIVRFYTANFQKRVSIWDVTLLACSLIGTAISGRRILYIAIPITLIALLLVHRGDYRKNNNFGRLALASIAAIAALWVTLQLIGVQPSSLLSRITNQFTLGDESDPRHYQRQVLLQHWQQRPIFGWGSGSTIADYSRNSETPWAWELTYESTLFSFGIAGFLLLTLWVSWILRRLARSAAPRFAFPMLAGLTSALICSITDPYLLKLDGMWMIFAPFATACVITRRKINHDNTSDR